MQIEQLLKQYLESIPPFRDVHHHDSNEVCEMFISIIKKKDTLHIDFHDIVKFYEFLKQECASHMTTMRMKDLRSFLRFLAKAGKLKLDPECIVINDGGYGEVELNPVFKPYMVKVRFKDGRRTNLENLRTFYYYRYERGWTYPQIQKKTGMSLRQLVRYRQYLEIAGKDKLLGANSH